MIDFAKKNFNRTYIKSLRLVLKFKKDVEGVVAVEFAFIGLPFFLLIFGILEISLVFLAEINLAHATADTARKLRTNQAGIDTLAKFKEDICDTVVFIPNCLSKLKVEVKTYDNFASIDTSFNIKGDGSLDDNFLFQSVDAGAIATVRTFIEWELFAKIPDLGLGNLPNNNRLVQGFAAFRKESG
ncbi:MAG: TadE/TadG family type IV pilus assembly protein [Rhodomicrobiaceae bacterium]